MPFETGYGRDSAPSSQVLLDELAEAGLIAKSDKPGLADVLEKTGAPIDQALAQLGLVSEAALANFYAAKFDVRALNGVITSIPDALIRRTNKSFLDHHRIVPIARDGKKITAAMVDPSDQAAIRGLSFALDATVEPVIVTASEFERLIGTLNDENEMTQSDDAVDGASVADDASKLKDLASAEPAVRLVNRLMVEASNARASDIHIEPKEREVIVRRRIDGVLAKSENLSRAQGLTAISRLKILAGLDIAERRRPQDGRIAFPIAGRPVDMRVSTTPTIHGESVVIRLLEKPAAALGLDALGFPPSKADALKRLIAQPNGILLITGPTGSGKTTTLYALLEMLAKRALKILTIEDPVEYRIEGVSQTQVNPAIDLNFATAMRSFLRHDPDVIMVGEMRDLETTRTAVQAALTGHLVLSTLHTNDAPSAITRLLDMGLEDYLVSSTLLGVVAQRLVRRLCVECGNNPEKRPECATCHGGGYAGRLAVSEVLNITSDLKPHLRAGLTASALTATALKAGFEPMRVDGDAKIRAGLTDSAELARVLGQVKP